MATVVFTNSNDRNRESNVTQAINPADFQPHAQLMLPSSRPRPVDRMRRRIRFAGLLAGILVIGLGGSATFVPIGGAVVASGLVDVASRVKKIAHPRGGVVSEILVHDGQHVEKGQILMRLDDTVSGAETRLTGQTVDQLIAQRARLLAESAGQSVISWPVQFAARSDPSAVNAMKAEQAQFSTRKAEAASLRAQLAARIAQYQAELAGYQAQIASVRRQSALIQPERHGIDNLYEKGLIPISRRNQIERSAIELEGSIGSLDATIAQTRGKIAEARAQLLAQDETRRADAGAQLATLNATINQQQINATTAADEQGHSLIRAPYPGVVNHLQVAAVGELVQPNQTFVEIVPDHDQLVIEASINPTDIDQVAIAQQARIRFSAFNRAATPEIPGTVTFVASDRTTSQDGKISFYAVRIALDRRALAAHPSIRLKQGMPAEIYISTGSRSMMTYMLKPLSDQFARAIKD